MAVRTFQFPQTTIDAVARLAELTGVEEEDWLLEVILDALGTYDWVLTEQAKPRTIVSLEPSVATQLIEQGYALPQKHVLKTMVRKSVIQAPALSA